MPLHLLRLLFIVGLPAAASAHPGGLDASGCHHNRKTGDYHCHRAPAPATAVAPRPAIPARAEPPAAAAAARGQVPTCHVGPRGGTYTITASGRKNYQGC